LLKAFQPILSCGQSEHDLAPTSAQHGCAGEQGVPEGFQGVALAFLPGPILSWKTWITPQGSQERLAALEQGGIRLPLGAPGFMRAPLDDVLDAAAAALAADRIVLGTARRVPDAEEEPAIWF